MTYAPEPKTESPPPPQEAAAATETKVAHDRTRKERDEEYRADTAAKDSTGTAAGRNVQNIPSARRGVVTVERDDAELAKKAKTSAEIRSVAGRQFRRDGNSWVDTAYEEGRATVVVKRGSAATITVLVTSTPK